jgi:hypothetical protein
VSEEAVRWWCVSPYADVAPTLPTYREESGVLVPALSEVEVTSCQQSCAAFIQWLDASQDDDDEEDEDEDDDEED